jgi:hypothetical protein
MERKSYFVAEKIANKSKFDVQKLMVVDPKFIL